MSKENQQYYVFISWKNGRDATKIHKELSNAEGEPSTSIVTMRIAKFQRRGKQMLKTTSFWTPSRSSDVKKKSKNL